MSSESSTASVAHRVASTCAVAAVASAALAASWLSPATRVEQQLAGERPAPAAADTLVTAPPLAEAGQPVACRGCNLPALRPRQL